MHWLVRRAAAAERAGVDALAVKNLKRAFVTHLHSDHTVGYPDFIFTPWVLRRNEPVEVYGPTGIGAMTDHLLEAYREDIDVRINDLEPANTEGYKVVVNEIKPGAVFRDENITVSAFLVSHGSRLQAFGFRFETRDRTIVISGDTAPTPGIIEHSMGCDVLIHEVYAQAGFDNLSEDWQNYHSNYHTSSMELGKIAAEAKPDLLILYHQLLWGTTPEGLLREIRRVYNGRVAFGNDLEIY
jgi:ribonuclease BN (tRNA processing enzyme)